MLATILGWLGSSGVRAIGAQINEAYKNRLEAQTNSEVIAADERIDRLQSQKSILLAEQNNRLTSWIRPLVAAPFVLFLWKVIVWDKVFSMGVTEPLSEPLGEIMAVIVGAYFLTRPLEKWSKK